MIVSDSVTFTCYCQAEEASEISATGVVYPSPGELKSLIQNEDLGYAGLTGHLDEDSSSTHSLLCDVHYHYRESARLS